MFHAIRRAHQARPFLLTTAAAALSSSLAQKATMKSIQFSQVGGPEVLELKDVDKPAAGPGQVRACTHLSDIRNAASSTPFQPAFGLA
jgi:hypothetical protein